MQAEEVERWKLKIRNSSMAILKDVQKLLTCSREGDSEKIASISSEIASNARELIDTIQEQVSDRTEAGKQVLQTMEQMKRSIVVTMKACESITSHSSDSEQNALKEECKIVAGNIKLIHQHASALKPSDFVRDESDSEDSLISSGIVSPRLRDAIDKVHDHSSLAHSSLQGLESASIDKDQQSLVSHAKALSAQCSELLQLARKFKFEALGVAAKESVLQVIAAAKAVFQSEEASEQLITNLKVASKVTGDAVDRLKEAFEVKTPSSSGSTASTSTSSSTASSSSSSNASSEERPSARRTSVGVGAQAAPSHGRQKSNTSSTGASGNGGGGGHSSSGSTASASAANGGSSHPADDDDVDYDDDDDNDGVGDDGEGEGAARGGASSSASSVDVASPPVDAMTPKDGIKQLQREFSSRDPEKVFKVQEQLGEGASGAVFRAVHRETKKVVAIKKMQVGVNNVTATVKEIKIMKDLKSAYTLKYYGCYNKDDAIWIIMEYCDGGSLQDIIDARENEEVCLTETQIAQIVAQVLQALEYLHSMKKIHRDIKAGNILLNSQGMAKLADFGISAQQVGDEKRTTTIGSSYWMAPETLMGGGYDSKADIWSLGITIMEMAEGIPPLIEEQPHKAAFRIVNDPPPKLSAPHMWSKSFVDFVSHCLTKNPEHRPSSADLRKHPFIADVGDAKESIIDLITWSHKDKKKKIKKKKLKSADVEDEFNLTIHFEDVAPSPSSSSSASKDASSSSSTPANAKTFLLPGHATAEDVCRQCAESSKLTKDPKSYGLFVVIDDGGKPKEKKMGAYDLPGKILSTLQKRFKGKKPSKAGGSEPFKFVYKSG
jgi:serine/threonine kinase 3